MTPAERQVAKIKLTAELAELEQRIKKLETERTNAFDRADQLTDELHKVQRDAARVSEALRVLEEETS